MGRQQIVANTGPDGGIVSLCLHDGSGEVPLSLANDALSQSSVTVVASSSYGVKRIGDGTPNTAVAATMIPADVVIAPGILSPGASVDIYWEVTHTTANGNFDPVVYPVLASYPSNLGGDGVRIQPGGATTERAGSGSLKFVVDSPVSQHMLPNPANRGDTGNPMQTTSWDVLNNGLTINFMSEFPANAPATETVTLKFYSVTVTKV